MPCSPRKARVLIKTGAAKTVKRVPFTIQLLVTTGETKQDVTLGIDSGYQNIGFSAVSESKELISGTVVLDNKTKERLDTRRMYRRAKRNKLWYRQPRFLNRSRKNGWLPPSIERRYQTHLNLINKIKSLLPVSKVRIEVGKFDIQQLENPNINSTDYQQGTMYQYRNRIGYLLAREHGTCQYCKKQGGGNWRLHHIWGKEKDRPEDWALVHEKCHKKLHAKKEEHILRKQKSKSYKDSIFMNIIRRKFRWDLDCRMTYGNYTFQDRVELSLEKTHVNDAFVIANGSNQERCKEFNVIQKRRNNRCLQKNRKGFKPSIRRQRYNIQPKDLVKIGNQWFQTNGVHCNGARLMVNKKSVSIKKVNSVFSFGSLIFN